ncbi:hypothetical protein B0I37DRAFT_68005 [Chaetomium sp. MPI-CAGE-AT-0009]|nr:hypothetical protein B0I37DRAFT_68005 [Chaetomium sp. MPI-CAGE-AT-0009]
MRIMRRELLGELLAMVRERGIPVHFGSAVATVVDSAENDEKVEFTFTDGRTASASLLVGADGIRSAVRSSLFPDDAKPQYAGILGINCVVERSRLRIPEGYGLPAIAMGKPGEFLLVPQRPDGSELYVGAQRRFPELDEAGWRALRQDRQRLYDMVHEQQADWPDVVQSALEAMTVDRMGFWAFHGLPPLACWLSEKSGRVIPVGDAAHAIPPTVGQGANQAVEDVCALAALLARLSPEVPLDAAARAWQGYRQARVQRILELTAQMNAKRLPEAEKAKLPPGAIWTDAGLTRGEGGELGWLYNVDLEEEVEKWLRELRLKTGVALSNGD